MRRRDFVQERCNVLVGMKMCKVPLKAVYSAYRLNPMAGIG